MSLEGCWKMFIFQNIEPQFGFGYELSFGDIWSATLLFL
jgi:hypothetical protein